MAGDLTVCGGMDKWKGSGQMVRARDCRDAMIML
jgi:hypothetical protein